MNKLTHTLAHHPKLTTRWTYLLTLFFLLCTSSSFVLASDKVNIDSSNGLAIHGYDPVAYFTESKTVEGKPEFTVEYKGNQWALSSAANKRAFLASPTAYIPQYGGFCAFAASQNALANIDPYAWTIHDKKLYLNYSIGTRDLWLKDKEALIIDADRNWPKLMQQTP